SLPRRRSGRGARKEWFSSRDVDDTEAVALGVGENHVVGIGGPLVPVHLGGAERLQAVYLSRLVLRVQVKVKARGYLDLGRNVVEREVRAGAVFRAEEHEVVARPVITSSIVESCLPERGLAPEIVDAQHGRADAQHSLHSIRALSETD